MRTERRALAVLNEDAKTVVRLYVESTARRLARRPRCAGYEAELERVRETLASSS